MRSNDDEPIDPALLETELGSPLPSAILDAGATTTPSADFTDRVLAARAASPAPRRRAPFAIAAAAALVLGGIGLRYALPRDASGHAQPEARESIALGTRGIAVAEAGSALDWHVARGDAEIEQRAGNVFYRVERGGPFVVRTPAGAVTVQGTCFRVEVMNMKISREGIIGAGIGAALATTALVTVYEGRVSYANEQGQVTIAAGEQARGSAGKAPTVSAAALAAAAQAEAALPAASSLSRDELVQRAETQQRELATLRARVQSFEAGGEHAGGATPKDSKPTSYMNQTKEELQEHAKACRLSWDEPSSNPVDPERATEMGLSDAERTTLNKVGAEVLSKTTADLRQLYIELTGDTAGADNLSARSLEEEIQEKTPRAEVQAAFARISREKAGLQAPPSDPRGMSAIERMMRMRTALGDRFERELGAAIGPDLAHQLREKNGGWGSMHSSSYGCP